MNELVRAGMAIHNARGEIKTDQPYVIESITGSLFSGRVTGITSCGPYQAVIPEVEGSAHITGKHTFFIDPEDPMKEGFIL